jgi:hypothetical protein
MQRRAERQAGRHELLGRANHWNQNLGQIRYVWI